MEPPAIRPPACVSAYAPRVRPLQKVQRLGWSAILGTWPMSCRPAPPLPLQLPHAVCSGPRSGALVLRPVLLCDPPNGRSALSLPLPPRTATLLLFAPRGQYAGRGSAARPDTLPVFMLWLARPCSVCPAPCSRSAPGACFALLCVVIKRAHADSLQHTRRPPASALRPALR